MPDVPLYVAIVTAGTSVVSSAVTQVIGWARDAGREKRTEAKELTHEQQEDARGRRELCTKLLSLARHYRVLMENAYDSREAEHKPDVTQVRMSVAEIANQTDKVVFNVPKAGTAAVALANQARELALTAEDKNREHGYTLVPGDFAEFDAALDAFRESARSALENL